MNAKLVIAILGLSVALSQVFLTEAINIEELNKVLNDPLAELLKVQCAGQLPRLDGSLIPRAYIRIFRVFYDRPDMLAGQLRNYNKFMDAMKQAANDDVRDKVIQTHSVALCSSFKSLLSLIGN